MPRILNLKQVEGKPGKVFHKFVPHCNSGRSF